MEEPICKLKDIYKALYNFEKSFAETYQITINEGMILCCMKDGEPKSANQICAFVGLSNSRVSRIINGVEQKEYISRNMGANDKRQMIFSLTELGENKVHSLQKNKIDFSELATLVKALVD